ncbi:MAG: PadR family transcriptional regulator [Oscillospiraceae bacterium]|jgi:PadR family transcriptional regulator PadR|nr:PadR family transcriptional regulator [Oscillospiraceae bacterium]
MAIQAGGALLDTCVLAMLSREDAYGYSLTQNVKEILDVSESTMYPVMRRLQTEDCLTVYDAPYSGRNRRYYKITEAGKERLRGHVAEWRAFKKKIDAIVQGEEGDDHDEE